MSLPGGADPGSCSRLGGALRSGAAGLSAAAHPLSGEDGLTRACDEVTAALDEVGSLLQVHAQELSEVAVAAERLAERVTAAGLVMQQWRVVEPYGLADPAVAQARRAVLPDLQGQAERIAAKLGRARAGLARGLDRAGARLDQVTRSAGA